MDLETGKLHELIAPIFDRMGVYLVDIQLRGQKGSRVLSVFADTKSGISLDQITEITREINEVLDASEVIPGSYRLEVSSPGLDREFKWQWEYEKNLGRDVLVVYTAEEKTKEMKGRLTEVSPDAIVLETKKEKKQIPMNAIVKARVHLKW